MRTLPMRSRRARLVVAIAAALLILLLAGTAWALKGIGHCRAQGGYATCVAAGSVNHPKALFVKVGSSPSQHVTVYWSTVCTKNSGAGSKSGHFSATTPVLRKIRMAYTAPDSCTVSADAQLSKKGSIWVVLKAKV